MEIAVRSRRLGESLPKQAKVGEISAERLASVASRFLPLVPRTLIRSYNWLAARSRTTVIAIAALLMGFIAFVDVVTDPLISFGLLQLVPVIIAAWFCGRVEGALFSFAAGVVWFSEEYGFYPENSLPAVFWNALSRTCVFLIIVFLLRYIRDLQDGLKQDLRDRSAALETEMGRRLAMEKEISIVSQREQQRIAYELHDGLGQELGALAFHAKLLAGKLGTRVPDLAVDAEHLVISLNQSIGRTRAVSRLLDPLGDDFGGLRYSLSQLADYSGRAFALACTFECPTELPRFSPEWEQHLYRIAQEAIRNAVEHGRSTSIEVRISLLDQELRLSITDNGIGKITEQRRRDNSRGMGLRIMEYRASVLGARLLVKSEPGHGCCVTCTVPLPPSAAESNHPRES